MQSFELGQLWEKILARTKPQLPPPIWESALHSGLIPASFTNNVLTLYPMHEFVRNLIMQNNSLMTAIKQAASEIVGAPVEISIFDGNSQNTTTVEERIDEPNINTNIIENKESTLNPLKEEVKISETAIQNDLPSIDKPALPQTIDAQRLYEEAIPSALRDDLAVTNDPFSTNAQTSEQPSEIGGLFNSDYYDEPVVIKKGNSASSNNNYNNNSNILDHSGSVSNNQEGTSDEFNFENNNLNPSYTFEAFVTGNTNRIAYAAAMSVAENPAQRYNPLFIYGDSGLGKTHLMHAIGNAILKLSPEKKVRCISSETFMNDLIHAIQNNRNEYFRDRYRSVDVLLVDDIQFLQSKQSTQTEFFHTFNTLQDSHKQIVLTSDTMPSNMKGMEKRLQTRFEGGYIVTIDTPDLETRIAILRSKADNEMFVPSKNIYETQGRVISRDEMNIVINTIASNVKNNIRTLEGSFTKVINTAVIVKAKITTEFVYDLIKDVIDPTQSRQLDMQLIQEHISEYFKIKMEDLLGSKRKKHLVHPRQIAMYLCRELINASYPSIAESFGKKDHTTVIHAYDKIDREIKQKKETKRYVEEIQSQLRDTCG